MLLQKLLLSSLKKNSNKISTLNETLPKHNEAIEGVVTIENFNQFSIHQKSLIISSKTSTDYRCLVVQNHYL